MTHEGFILRKSGYDSPKKISEGSEILKDFTPNQDLPTSGVCFRWGCTANVPSDVKIINKASAIHKVFSKGIFRKELYENNLTVETFTDFGEFLDKWDQTSHYVVRPEKHQRSENLYVCKTAGDLYRTITKSVMSHGWYASKLIDKSAEYRVLVVSGRAIAVVKKKPKTSDVSWGCVEEGSFDYVPWSEFPTDVVKKAIDAVVLSGLDFGAVDVMVCKNTKGAYVLEVNTSPWLSKYYAKTFRKAFEYILNNENTNDNIPVSGETWKHMIHPAIFEGAL